MSHNGSVSASRALQLPVNLHGIRLGQPVDLLLDQDSWNVLGNITHCRDANGKGGQFNYGSFSNFRHRYTYHFFLLLIDFFLCLVKLQFIEI